DAFDAFMFNPNVQTALDNRRLQQNEMKLAAVAKEGGEYRYSFGSIDIYEYGGHYTDDNGVTQPILPSGTVIVGSTFMEGVRAFGAIRDEAAGFQAMPYYPKSWVDQDPSVRYLLMQSAPLVVPTRVNASLAATVL
ncbi:MAG TPA: major capsid protein, partial [Methylothermaceae bacterium]|nr:major capsid protein [Methylothermaceae bacterium]